MKHTSGKASFDNNIGCKDVYAGNNKIAICFTTGINNESQDKANAELICEAFNVANETGKTPRQLADENKELLEAVLSTQKFFDDMPKGQFGNLVFDFGLMNDMFINIRKSINKATK